MSAHSSGATGLYRDWTHLDNIHRHLLIKRDKKGTDDDRVNDTAACCCCSLHKYKRRWAEQSRAQCRLPFFDHPSVTRHIYLCVSSPVQSSPPLLLDVCLCMFSPFQLLDYSLSLFIGGKIKYEMVIDNRRERKTLNRVTSLLLYIFFFVCR